MPVEITYLLGNTLPKTPADIPNNHTRDCGQVIELQLPIHPY